MYVQEYLILNENGDKSNPCGPMIQWIECSLGAVSSVVTASG